MTYFKVALPTPDALPEPPPLLSGLQGTHTHSRRTRLMCAYPNMKIARLKTALPQANRIEMSKLRCVTHKFRSRFIVKQPRF